jgi:hypothetical protein
MTQLYWLEKLNPDVDFSFPWSNDQFGDTVISPVDRSTQHDHASIDPEDFEAGGRIEPMHKVVISPSWSILKRKGAVTMATITQPVPSEAGRAARIPW